MPFAKKQCGTIYFGKSLKELQIDWLIDLPEFCDECSYFTQGGNDYFGEYTESECLLSFAISVFVNTKHNGN